jgi:hypothetical protein
MIFKNLDDKNTMQKVLYTVHLAGLGFFIKWISEFIGPGPIYLFIAIPILIFIQYRYSKYNIDGIKNLWRDALLVVLVFGYGVGSLWSFVGHFFLTEQVAEYIGWHKSPFQIELAGYHLAFSVMCLLSVWNRNLGYWGAMVHGMAIFLFTAAGVHFYEMIAHQNNHPGNAGIPIIINNTIYPALVIFIYWMYKTSRDETKNR